jgi:hypothetical protein
MSSLRRVPLFAVLALVLIVAGVLSSMAKDTDPTQLPSGLSLASNAESTALYCTGLTSAKDGASGRVTFVNTSSSAHVITIDDVSDAGGHLSRQASLGAYQSISVDPSAHLTGDSFGVGAQVSGGGVVGVEATNSDTSEAPCISTGVTNWFGAGFDTTVGSNAELSVYNPTATPAVFNVSTYSSAGYVAPPKFQGYAVGPHAQAELDLGTALVNLTNVGVHVHVLRGALVIVGVQKSGATVSLNSGSTEPSTAALFPRVTTAESALAQIRLANPGSQSAQVSLSVTLAPFHVPTQSVTVPAYGSALASITPNPAIPASGYASITLSSNHPVIATLATGTGTDVALTSPELPESEFFVDDVTGHGFDAAALTNTSTKSITVKVTTLKTSAVRATGIIHLDGGATADLKSDFAGLSSLHGVLMLVQASKPALLVTLTLPTKPVGTAVVQPLDGR